jgi:hypothetical protein
MLFTHHIFFFTGGRGRGLHQVKLDNVMPLGLELPFHIFPRNENRTHSFVKLQTIATD